MRLALVCNPDSGRGADADGTAAALRAAGADVVSIVKPGELGGLPDDLDRLVAAGGDGTLGHCAEWCGTHGVPLAVVAMGTANDFARAYGLPRDQEPAVELAARGTTLRRLELGRMDGMPFLNTVAAGLSPAAAERAAPWKQRIGALAYPAGALLAGARTPPLTCTVVVAGETLFEGDAWQVMVAASGAFGAGAKVEPADPQDGMLDAVVVPAGSRRELPGIARAMKAHKITSIEGARHMRGATVELHVPAGTTLNVDGELVDAGPLVRLSAEPGAFELVVPPGGGD